MGAANRVARIHRRRQEGEEAEAEAEGEEEEEERFGASAEEEEAKSARGQRVTERKVQRATALSGWLHDNDAAWRNVKLNRRRNPRRGRNNSRWLRVLLSVPRPDLLSTKKRDIVALTDRCRRLRRMRGGRYIFGDFDERSRQRERTHHSLKSPEPRSGFHGRIQVEAARPSVKSVSRAKLISVGDFRNKLYSLLSYVSF